MFEVFFEIEIQNKYSRGDWTKTSHLRAIDVWIVLCYIGVFSALIEYCLVLYLTRVAQWEAPFIDTKTSIKNNVQVNVCTQ